MNSTPILPSTSKDLCNSSRVFPEQESLILIEKSDYTTFAVLCCVLPAIALVIVIVLFLRFL
jgi:type IV secretory pathway component VirB8